MFHALTLRKGNLWQGSPAKRVSASGMFGVFFERDGRWERAELCLCGDKFKSWIERVVGWSWFDWSSLIYRLRIDVGNAKTQESRRFRLKRSLKVNAFCYIDKKAWLGVDIGDKILGT